MAENKRIIKDSSALGQFGSAIAQICEEKGIDKDRVIESIEAALAAAYKKDYGKKGQIVLAKMKESTGEVSFKRLREVVDETTRTIDEEYIHEEDNSFEGAVKSEEVIERAKRQEEEGDEEATLPKFNWERDIMLEDAKKIVKDVKIGDFLEVPLETKDEYGRVASQTAKQVIIQRIREAERDSMYEEFKGKEGEIVSGTVQRVEGNRVFIDMGKAVGVLFPSEQIPGEQYRIGQRLRVYVEKVESDTRGPGILLSRRHPNLLLRLFELEVPEIFAGTVEVKAVAREAGARSKIAVLSKEEGIDPIGSCVGQKGTRVQAIIDEVNGEKIDIIEWDDDPEKLITASLSPAKVIKVETSEEEKDAKAFVMQDQLSLAIGKRGQNVRLAAKLTGWKVDVEAVGGESIEEDVEKMKEDLEKVQEEMAEKVADAELSEPEQEKEETKEGDEEKESSSVSESAKATTDKKDSKKKKTKKMKKEDEKDDKVEEKEKKDDE